MWITFAAVCECTARLWWGGCSLEILIEIVTEIVTEFLKLSLKSDIWNVKPLYYVLYFLVFMWLEVFGNLPGIERSCTDFFFSGDRPCTCDFGSVQSLPQTTPIFWIYGVIIVNTYSVCESNHPLFWMSFPSIYRRLWYCGKWAGNEHIVYSL